LAFASNRTPILLGDLEFSKQLLATACSADEELIIDGGGAPVPRE